MLSAFVFGSVRQSLSQVVTKMARVNHNLDGINESNGHVKEVAAMWREAFRRSDDGDASLQRGNNDSSAT
jgi:hypothetical protein